jgi:hypothetical protein
VTRAVIELSEDISPIMPQACVLIEGCGYSQEARTMGFSYKGLGVIVEAKKITINNAVNEVTAREVINWLMSKINSTGLATG